MPDCLADGQIFVDHAQEVLQADEYCVTPASTSGHHWIYIYPMMSTYAHPLTSSSLLASATFDSCSRIHARQQSRELLLERTSFVTPLFWSAITVYLGALTVSCIHAMPRGTVQPVKVSGHLFSSSEQDQLDLTDAHAVVLTQ